MTEEAKFVLSLPHSPAEAVTEVAAFDCWKIDRNKRSFKEADRKNLYLRSSVKVFSFRNKQFEFSYVVSACV